MTGASTESLQETRRVRRQREILERLVHAAREFIQSRDLGSASVQDITDTADLGKGTFYNYFHSKYDLIPESIRERNNMLATAIQTARKNGNSALGVLLEHIDRQAWHAPLQADRLIFYSNILSALTNQHDVRTAVAQRLDEALDQLVALVEMGQGRGEFRTDIAARELAAYVHVFSWGVGVISWIHHGLPVLGKGDDKTLLHFLLETLTPRVPTGARATRRSPVGPSTGPADAKRVRRR
jgi:AcrR family transcriptional regulator